MNNKRKIIWYIIVAVIVVAITVIGILYEKNEGARNILDKYFFFKEKHENDLPSIMINGSDDLNVHAFNGSIVILKDNVLKFYNQYGGEEGTLDIAISNPIFNSDGNYLCIAEKEGKNIYVIYNKSILWKKTLENDITDIEINENGYVAVSLTGTIYKTIIQTFDKKGTDLFTTFLSSTYVVDMELSEDNKYLAIAEANFSGILVQSNIKIISVEKAKIGEKEYIDYTYSAPNGDLIINLNYQNRNELACVFDNHIEIIKNNSNTTASDFTNEDVLFVDINNKIIKIIKEEGKTYLQIINSSGTYKKYEIQEPKSMWVSNGTIALNLGSEIYLYNNSGWVIKKYYATQEINKVVLCEGLAGIVYNDKIELISL